MSRGMLHTGRALRAAVACTAVALAAPTFSMEAQQAPPRTQSDRVECRCVDRDGKPIERCSCFTMPHFDGVVARAFGLGAGRARLGVTIDDEGDARGARVSSVLEDGPAHEAGIREGDVLVRVDGHSLLAPLGPELERTFHEDSSLPVQRLMALVSEIDPGQDVAVEFLRDGERRTVTVEARELDAWGTLAGGRSFRLMGPDRGGVLAPRLDELRELGPRGERFGMWGDSTIRLRHFSPDASEGRAFFRFGDEDAFNDEILRACPRGEGGSHGMLMFSDGCVGGVRLVEVNAELGGYFGTSTGVLVADVHEDSKLGLRPGDVILSVGDREATDPDRVRRILASYGADEPVALRIMRQKREMNVEGTLAR